MGFPPAVSNRIWLLRSLGAWRAFRAGAEDPRGTQARLLRSILRWNAGAEYGTRFGFGGIRTIRDFQERVPVVRYDDLSEEMEAIQAGRNGVLTSEPVLLLQPSSGSTAATKLIPFTATLRTQFNRAVSIWSADLFWHRPELMDGPAYWSVSPLAGQMPTVSGPVKVGFEDDGAYLGGLTRSVVSAAMAVPGELARLTDPEVHRYATLLHLLGAAEARIFSVWSPTFLALLLAPLEEWWESLVSDVEEGTLTAPGGDPVGTEGADLPVPEPNPRRAKELRAVGPHDLPGLWPKLGLLSAWADGSSGPYAGDLRRSFPGVPFQAKGLVATEAFITIPRWGFPGGHPAITSHFLEFIPEGAGVEDALLVDELEERGRYEVLATTGGGLFRYRLGDIVEAVGEGGGLPLLRFVGRIDRVSDFFGEKLSDGFVAGVLDVLTDEGDLSPTFSLLAPERTAGRIRYVWFLTLGSERRGGRVPDTGITGPRLDRALSENFHYATCRRLGQLAPAEVCPVSEGASLRFLEVKGREGQRLGDVKIPALETGLEWREILGAARQVEV